MSTLLGKVIADFSTALSTDIIVGGTTATLSSATDDDGVALPSGRYFFTLDNSNSSKEHISCDLVGTALTNIKSVSRQGAETTGVVRKHRIGTSVTLTDFAHLKFINDLISGTTQLNSAAPLGYDGAPAGLTGNQLATVTYVLGVVNGGTVTFDKQVISNQTSGESVTATNIAYFKEADVKWWKADADLTATFDQLYLGVVQETVGADATCSVAISGPVGGFSGLTPGAKYYLSNTAGAISTTPGSTSVFIGWALNTTTIIFAPEKNGALAGSQGVPSSANKYVTQDNVYTGEVDQSQTTQDSLSTVGEADTTGLRNDLAQSFIPAKTKILGVKLYKSADTGSFTGTVTVSLQADTAGSPSGSALGTVTITNATWLALATGEFSAVFTSEYTSLTVGSLYWIVVETSTSDTSNHPNLGINTAGGYSSGSAKYKNTTDGWVAISTIDLYFKTLQGVTTQIPGSAKFPTTIVYEYTEKGSAATRFDITNPSGTTFRYTYDGTGTDPGITSTTFPIGGQVVIQHDTNMTAANEGRFTITGSGTNYFEVTNASGVAENDKTLTADGRLAVQAVGTTWTKPTNLKYIVVEAVGGGGGTSGYDTDETQGIGHPGSGAGYAKKILSNSVLHATETVSVGAGGGGQGNGGATPEAGVDGTSSTFGAFITANGGTGGSATLDAVIGGTATGGDINISGQAGYVDPANFAVSGSSQLGRGGFIGGVQMQPTGYGAGGIGRIEGDSNAAIPGRNGVVIITEYYQ